MSTNINASLKENVPVKASLSTDNIGVNLSTAKPLTAVLKNVKVNAVSSTPTSLDFIMAQTVSGPKGKDGKDGKDGATGPQGLQGAGIIGSYQSRYALPDPENFIPNDTCFVSDGSVWMIEEN